MMMETKNSSNLLLLLIALAFPSTAISEMPFQRLDAAAYIFWGNVTKIEELPNDGDLESRWHHAYIIHVFVHNVKRGGLTAGETFKVQTFQNRRPFDLDDGWVGPAGHTGIPDVGQMIEVYANKDHRGVYPIWYIIP